MRVPLFAVLLLVPWASAAAHGGGLNAEGCHHNRRLGDYHCHRAPAVVSPAVTPQRAVPATAQSATSAGAQPVPSSTVPTCHVGPRGGTYTITKSGKKNYSGC